ncbi:MAG: hypothetical protein CL748_01600 [Chloroflexi bacterium]|nr:hypothetical protein [Chloroflexota bacterium]|tara:strand:+ start:242 stop:856 length:615 start_codon:yes stop_codon:yes gene_type:complete
MLDEIFISKYIFCLIISYLLGSVPVAFIAGKLYKVNIFEIGSKQAGATNVFRELSRRTGVAVMLIDSSKGLLAIIICRLYGFSDFELILPASCTILGHWNSPFTKFKGGDGVSTLTGLGLGIAPYQLVIPYIISAIILFTMIYKKYSHPTIWGGTILYIVFILMSIWGETSIDFSVVAGLSVIGLCIMLHSMYFHKKHKENFKK